LAQLVEQLVFNQLLMSQKATCTTLSSLLESKNPPSADFLLAIYP